MSFETLRVYDAWNLYDMDLPDWYHEADRLSSEEGLSWYQAFINFGDRALVGMLDGRAERTAAGE